KKSKVSATRRNQLKSLMLQIAKSELEKEAANRIVEKENYLTEHCPPLQRGSSVQELQVFNYPPHQLGPVYSLAKEIHWATKLAQFSQPIFLLFFMGPQHQIEDLNQKVQDLKGKFKRPALKRVRLSADAMLRALLGSKHKVSMDLRANLKQVKKEDSEKEKDRRDVGDWRKNIEEKAGMEGRKKMFESEA
uniref:Troponin I, fast skeletal muscle n=1 Tax=Latimeria chalumnae TaxID=7897 RepID=H3AFF1_LATCH